MRAKTMRQRITKNPCFRGQLSKFQTLQVKTGPNPDCFTKKKSGSRPKSGNSDLIWGTASVWYLVTLCSFINTIDSGHYNL